MASTGIEAKPVAKAAAAPGTAPPTAISTPLIGTGATPAPTLSAFVEATVAPEPSADQARKRRVLEFHMADHAKKMRDETEHFTRSENFLKFTRTSNKSAVGLASFQYSISSGAADESEQPSTLFLTPSPGLSLVCELGVISHNSL